MADLQLKGIYKRYAGGVTAVSDFTLDIEDKRVHHFGWSFRMR